MKSAEFKTLIAIAFAGPIVGSAAMFLSLLLGTGSIAEAIQAVQELYSQDAPKIFIVLEVLSLLTAGCFIGIGRAFGHLPKWAAFCPGFVGVVIGVFIYAYVFEYKWPNGAHGPFALLIVGPPVLSLIIGIISYFGIRQFWVLNSQ